MSTAAQPDTPASRSAPPRRAVIVGTGIAGATAAQTLRKEGFDGEIILIGADAQLPYRRTMLTKDLLSGRADEDRVLLRSGDAWRDLGVEVRTSTTVTRLDAASRRIDVSGPNPGAVERIDYDSLLLATGGRPRPLAPAGGPPWPGVHQVRDLADALALRSALAGPAAGGRSMGGDGELVVIGAGLIGCEVASVAAEAGARVTVLEAAARPLERVLPEPVAAMLTSLHAEHGVTVHTGVRLEEISRDGDGLTVHAQDGRVWRARAVVGAVGMVPDTALAEAAGLDVGPGGDGILVDERCATSVDGVFAAGDAARFPNPLLGGTQRIEHWNHAQAHGAAAARAILGSREPYRDVPWCWTNQYGTNLQIAGWPGAAETWLVDGDVEARDFLVVGTREGREVAAIAVARTRELRAVRARIAESIAEEEPAVVALR